MRSERSGMLSRVTPRSASSFSFERRRHLIGNVAFRPAQSLMRCAVRGVTRRLRRAWHERDVCSCHAFVQHRSVPDHLGLAPSSLLLIWWS